MEMAYDFCYQLPVVAIIFQCQFFVFVVKNLSMNEFWYLDIKHLVDNVKASMNENEEE